MSGEPKIDKKASRILLGCGIALAVLSAATLAATMLYGLSRIFALCFLAAFNMVIASFALVKFLGARGAFRQRCAMVLTFCLVMAMSMVLQIAWPIVPFAVFGCIISSIFILVFVTEAEQSEKHAAELENALARERAAEESRNVFFSIVNHDIRTPLNAILGYSELLRGGLSSPAEMCEALDSIRASGTTLLQLVNDVLDLEKMDVGKMTLCPEPMRLSRLVDDVFASFRLAASEKGIELVDRVADVPVVLLDEHRFRQILFNLIGNAVKFTSRGVVTVSASYTGSKLEVSVSDTGCGIPPDMLTHVLDPFVQVQDRSHSSDRVGGTGLGLSICRSLVRIMGGRLFVESELGRGTTFSICIPNVAVCGGESLPHVVPHPKVSRRRLPERILLVDDSSVNRLVLSAFLKKAGIGAIDCAGDGVEALSVLDLAAKEGRLHDIVFTDFWMPNMNGFELVEKLRGDDRFADLPVYAVTGDTESCHDTRAEMFTDVLFKPLTYDRLMEVLYV